MATISQPIRIRAPQDAVYEAITTTDGLANWYASRVDGDLGEVGEVTVTAEDGQVFRWKPLGHTGWNEDDDSIPTCNTLWGILIGRLRDFAETSSSPSRDEP